MEDLPEEILDFICQYVGIYNFNLSKTCVKLARITERYKVNLEDYVEAMFRQGDQLVRKQNMLFRTKNIEDLIINGHVELLDWCYNKGLVLRDSYPCIAARENRLDVLKWLKRHNCSWDERVCVFAAKNNNLEMLQWSKENGCPWDKYECLLSTTDLETSLWIRRKPYKKCARATPCSIHLQILNLCLITLIGYFCLSFITN
jgi:hypothetical protein